jgi:hypothetical protein
MVKELASKKQPTTTTAKNAIKDLKSSSSYN